MEPYLVSLSDTTTMIARLSLPACLVAISIVSCSRPTGILETSTQHVATADPSPWPSGPETVSPTPTATSTLTRSPAQTRGIILFGGVRPQDEVPGLWIFGLDATCLAQPTECPEAWMGLVTPQNAGPGHNRSYDWSPDGTRITFISDRDAAEFGDFSLFVMQSDGSAQTNILDPDSASVESPRWSPTDDWIAYQVVDDWPTLDGPSHLGLIRPDGSDPRTLPDAMLSNGQPAWSPDGKKVAFLGNEHDGEGPALVVMDLDTGAFNTLGDGIQAIHATYPPDWSSDGALILFAGQISGIEDIFVVDVRSGDATNLTQDSASDRNPLWSPDDSLVAYASVRAGTLDLIILEFATGLARVVESTAQREGFPSWSPDGSYLVYQVADGKAGDSYLKATSLDGAVSARLTDEDVIVLAYPSWSP